MPLPPSDSDPFLDGKHSSWRPSVLLVDDHPANLTALDAVLSPLDVVLVHAQSGREALERVGQQEFAVLLLDLRMPGLDGLETAGLIRERHPKAHPPMVMITAAAPEMHEIRAAYARGVVDFVQKPFAPELLVAKVSAFARIARQQHQLVLYEEALRKRFEQQLVGIVSHDLRAPLNAIMLGAEVALRRAETDPKSRHTFEITKSAAGRAGRLIHDLLDYTQVLSGAMLPIRRVEACLFELAQRVLDELRLSHPKREFIVEHKSPVRGSFDPDRLSQVLTNLITNATAYGGDEPISIRLAGHDSDISLEVHNWGEPIPGELIPELFQPLKRGGSRPGRGSIGFGLFIVREVARAHGGTVVVDSTLERGTTFALRIPRAPTGGGS